jgi:peptide chain release factor 2
LISAIEKIKAMEAERINALSALLADLTTREAELRRYL